MIGDVSSGQHDRETTQLTIDYTHTQHSSREKHFPRSAGYELDHTYPFDPFSATKSNNYIRIICIYTHNHFWTTFDGWTKRGLELVYY